MSSKGITRTRELSRPLEAAGGLGRGKRTDHRAADQSLAFGATTIVEIYKDRWQIEIFFKTIKQNLKIKTFVGTSPNALLIQIWTAVIAILVLKYLKHRSRFQWSLSNLVAMLRCNLFAYRDLWG